jgi:adenylate cyclase class IV
MNGALTFNSNSLQTFNRSTRLGINTNTIEHTNLPDKIAEILAKADADQSVIPNITYPNKKIGIAGTIHGSTQADLDDRIDNFKGYFNGKDKNLDINYGSNTRRYIATVNTINIQRENHALFATFRVEFICSQPFGLDISTTSLINQLNNTAASYTATPTVGGNAPYQLPVFTITLDAITGSGDYLQISNDNNNQSIELYGLGLVSGDVIEIDCFNRTVKVNNTDVNYYGTFIELEPGPVSVTYSDGFTTRTVDIVATYYKRWL